MSRARVHYAWIVLALCCFGLLAAQGVRLAFGAFILPWERDFGADRGALSLVSFLSFVVYGLTQPLVGRLVDRHGGRRVLAASVLLVGLSLLAIAQVRSTPGLLVLYGVVASLGFGGASGVAASVAVATWFRAHRGLAFGIIEAGFGAGQLLVVPGSLLMIGAWGWRATMLALGGLLILVVAPILLLFLRSAPADLGLAPYGDDPAVAAADGAGGEHDGRGRLLTSRAFWGLALPFFVCGFTTTGMMDTHLIPFAHDHGFSTGAAGVAVGALAFCNIVGTLASGPVADRWDGRQLLGVLYGVRALSLVALLAARDPGALLAFAAIFGLVDFATLAPTQLLASRYFRGHGLGLVFGLLALAHQLGSALGAYVPGALYGRLGGYQLVFAATAVALGGAASLSFALPPARREQRLVAAAGAS